MRTRSVLALVVALVVAGCVAQPPAGDEEPLEGIGPAGGTVVSADGKVRLAIPPGALSQSVPIEIVAADASSAAPAFEEGTEFAGSYEFRPAGLVFAQPARVAFTVDAPAGRGGAVPIALPALLSDGEAEGLGNATMRVQDGAVVLEADVRHFSHVTWVWTNLALYLEDADKIWYRVGEAFQRGAALLYIAKGSSLSSAWAERNASYSSAVVTAKGVAPIEKRGDIVEFGPFASERDALTGEPGLRWGVEQEFVCTDVGEGFVSFTADVTTTLPLAGGAAAQPQLLVQPTVGARVDCLAAPANLRLPDTYRRPEAATLLTPPDCKPAAEATGADAACRFGSLEGQGPLLAVAASGGNFDLGGVVVYDLSDNSVVRVLAGNGGAIYGAAAVEGDGVAALWAFGDQGNGLWVQWPGQADFASRSSLNQYPLDVVSLREGRAVVVTSSRLLILATSAQANGGLQVERSLDNQLFITGERYASFVSAAEPAAGTLLIVDRANPGRLWQDGPNGRALIGALGDDPRRIRCLDAVCVISNYGSDSLTAVTVGAGGATIVGEAAVGDGPVGLDLRRVGDEIHVVSTGFVDRSLHVTRFGLDGATLGDATVALPEDCQEPGHAIWLPGGPTQILVTCYGSGTLAVVGAANT